MNSAVFLRSTRSGDVFGVVRELMEACSWRELIPPGSRVAVKPNLCTERPEQIHTANTSAVVLRSVCTVLREQTDRITIVESDGARYPAEAAFKNNGVYEISRDLGIRVQNLSKDELIEVDDPRMKGFGLAKTWLEADAAITLPVLKTHATTVFTGAIKNQWGCVPRYDRILLHKYLHELVSDLNKMRPIAFGLMDGIVGMQGRGPINGYPINLNVLLASRDPVALDATGMRLIGLDPYKSQHIVHGSRIGIGQIDTHKITVDGPFADLRTTAEPAVEDWAIKLMNQVAKSPFLTRNVMLNDRIFYPVRKAVGAVRWAKRVIRGR